MDVLLVFFTAFILLPFLLLLWMPGWKSLLLTGSIFLLICAYLWFDFATAPRSYDLGAPVITWVWAGFSMAVIAGIGTKALLLRRKEKR